MPGFLGHTTDQLAPELQATVELLGPDCSAERAAGVISGCSGLLRACLHERVAPLVRDRWRHQLSACLAPAAMEHWDAACLKLLVRSARQQAGAREFLAELAARSVPAIVLRGLWMGRAYYPRPELRGHTDIDLIVPECTDAGCA